MQDFFIAVFLMLAAIPSLRAETPERNPFVYDYESLKVAGLTMAGILCALGIIILLSGKCRCKFNQKDQRHRAQEQQLITPGTASGC